MSSLKIIPIPFITEAKCELGTNLVQDHHQER